VLDEAGRRHAAVAVGVFAVSLALYLRTLAPTVLDSNGGEFQYIAFVLGIPHPTGYPLYILLGKLLTCLPLGDVAYRVSMVSALGAAGAVALVYLATAKLVGVVSASLPDGNNAKEWQSEGLGVVIGTAGASLGFASSITLWQAATVAEVHGLNSCFVALVLFALVRLAAGSPRAAELLAFVYGLSLAHHRLMIWFLPGIILSLWVWRGRFQWTRERVVLCAVLFLLPLTLYLYFPVRAAHLFEIPPQRGDLWPLPGAVLRGLITPYYSGKGVGGFLDLISGRGFSGDLGFGSWEQLGQRLRYGFDLSLAQAGPWGAALALLGLVTLARRQRSLAIALLLTYVLVFGFDLQYSHGQIWYYYLPTFAIGAVWSGVGMSMVLQWLSRLGRRVAGRRAQPSVFASASVVILLLIGWNVVKAFPQEDKSWDNRARQYASSVLGQPLRDGALLFGCWDAVTPLRYMQFAEGRRPDLWIMHADPSLPEVQPVIAQVLEEGEQVVLLQCGEAGTYQLPFGHWVSPVYLPLPSLPSGLEASDVVFGDKVSLAGYRLSLTDRTARLAFYWRVLGRLGKDYKVFVHWVEASTGQRWAQEDKLPVTSYYLTSHWRTGDLLEDTYSLTLPAAAPPGEYSLLVGFYALDGGQRLQAAGTGVGRGGDALTIGVTIR